MLFKNIKPLSPSLRDKVVVFRQRSRKCKHLLLSINRPQGRDVVGNIVCYHKGGGNLFRYRAVNYHLNTLKLPGIFLGYDFDNYRTGWLGLIKYLNGSYGYMLAATNMRQGDYVNKYKVRKYVFHYDNGDCVPLSEVQKGMLVYNISIDERRDKGCYARAAGSSGLVKVKDNEKGTITIRLPSRELKVFLQSASACIGTVANEFHYIEHFSKAGVGKIFNYKPHVRGEAMNAVDHHHGGKAKGGKKPKTPWGKIIKK